MANYYVRKTGSDSGSSGPFKTIQYALNQADPNDTIIVGNGTYAERLNITNSNITIRAENAHKATITGKSGSLYTIEVRGNNVAIRDMVITYSGTKFSSRNSRNHKVLIRGDNCTLDNNLIYGSGEVEKKDYYFNSWKFACVALTGSKNSVINNNVIYGSTFGVDVKGSTQNLTISNNKIGWTNQSCINITCTKNMWQNLLIINNDLFDSYFEDGIQTNQSEYNCDDADQAGIFIYYNRIYNNAENAIDLKGARNVVIEGNAIWGTMGSNDGYKNPPNRSSLNGIIHGNYGGPCRSKAEQIIIRNNVVFDDAMNGIGIGQDDIAYYHNTLVNLNRDYKGTNSSYNTGTLPQPLVLNKGGTRKYVKNNIFAGSNNKIAAYSRNTRVEYNGNAYMPFPNGTNRFNNRGANYATTSDGRSGITTYSSFNAFKSGLSSVGNFTGNESQGQEITGGHSAQFKNVPLRPTGPFEKWDFTLKPSSPAYDAAIPLTTLTGGSGTNRQASNADKYFIAGDIIETATGSYEIASVSGNNIVFTSSVPDANGTGIYWRKGPMAVNTDFFNSPRPQGITYDIGFHEFGGGGNSVNFGYTPTPVLTNTLVTFTDNSSTDSPITTYAWEVDEGVGFSSFGGNNSVETYTFTSTGQVSVKLSVTTTDGTFTKTQTFVVSDENASGCTNNEITNGDFATNLSNWSSAGNVTPTWVAGEAKLVIGTSSTTNRFFQEFAAPSDWVEGAQIAFSFDARTDIAGKIIEVEMRDGSAGGAAFANDITFTLTTSMQTYNGLFALNTTPTGPIHFRYRFLNAGGSTADNQTVFLDNVCIGENTQGTITAVITPFATTGASPYSITLDASTSIATNGIDSYTWEIPGAYYSATSEETTTVTLNQCCDYEVKLTISGPDGVSTATETVTVDSCGFTCPGNLVDEPDFDSGYATARWTSEITGNNVLESTNEYCSGYFIPTYNDVLGDIYVSINGIAVEANRNYNVSFKSYSPFDYGDSLTVYAVDTAGNILYEEVVDYDSSDSLTTTFSFTTLNDTDARIRFLLNSVDSVHIYNVCVTEGSIVATNPVPPSVGGYVTDSNGNISNYSSHPQFINFFNTTDSPNMMGYLMFSYNIFTGLGQLIEPLSEQVLRFNIDTGDYELLGKNEAGIYEQISTGTSSALAAVGAHHSLEYGAVSRGEGYWNSYQADQVAKTTADPNVPTWVAQPWPTKFEEQYQLAQSL